MHSEDAADVAAAAASLDSKHVCMYVCVYIYIYICMRRYVCIYIYIYTHMQVYIIICKPRRAGSHIKRHDTTIRNRQRQLKNG